MSKLPHDVVLATSGNMSAQILCTPIALINNDGYAVQAAWSGVTGSGTLYLQASCDQDITRPVLGWSPIMSSAFTVNSASGNDMWNVTVAKYRWAQLVWQPSTGGATGTLTAGATVK